MSWVPFDSALASFTTLNSENMFWTVKLLKSNRWDREILILQNSVINGSSLLVFIEQNTVKPVKTKSLWTAK